MPTIKETLDKFYAEYDFKERISKDPIEFPHRYKTPRDIEVAGYIAASLAYGKVEMFKPVIASILTKMGESPYTFLGNYNIQSDKSRFENISYRFNNNDDILALLYALHCLIKHHGTIKSAFVKHFQGDIYTAIINFIDYILTIDLSAVYGVNEHPRGFKQFFPSPKNKSACKRINMFLRWMTRDKDTDFGVWSEEIPKSALIIPLDTHISRIARCLGLTKRKSNDWKTAAEITDALKKFDPEDPIKYDFALCHHGISGACKSVRNSESCNACVFNNVTIDLGG
ncbi:hypothetical protein MCHI_001068 [Candidatus Magnetoovum chiemensis]|nr:hypothetical protein MCHI_001068 [Candidatus Magnetoovum chiemensis]